MGVTDPVQVQEKNVTNSVVLTAKESVGVCEALGADMVETYTHDYSVKDPLAIFFSQNM